MIPVRKFIPTDVPALPPQVYASLGEMLAERRKQVGYTQLEMAIKLGMGTHMGWSLVERGVNVLSKKHFGPVAKILKLDVKHIIDFALDDERRRLLEDVAPKKRGRPRAAR